MRFNKGGIMSEPKGITGNGLKMIAIVTMLIDHIAYVILERGILSSPGKTFYDGLIFLADLAMRLIGRLAFIIFLFLLVEGFRHTSNVWKYAVRLLAFAVISEIPFNIAVNGTVFSLGYQSVYVTLFLSLIMMIAFEKVQDVFSDNLPLHIVLDILVFLCASAAAYFAHCDYTTLGIAMAAVMYFFRNNRYRGFLVLACVIVLYTAVPVFLYNNGFVPYYVVSIFGGSSPIELFGIVSFVFIRRYNGERGSFNFKYAYYIFYPAHLLILGLITAFAYNNGLPLF